MEHVDVIIVGAGLSGIGAARQLQDQCPGKSFLILEGRERIGGTWDLFRYPGIRSDSDMYTMGYDSKPWREPKAIADGPSILGYIREAATERGIDRHIRYAHQVEAARWSSATGRWTVQSRHAPSGEVRTLSCNVLFMCSGYYNYAHGYQPDIPGLEQFAGPVVHPQQWPADLDYAGKRVVIIGSGATAMTLVPALAERAARVTMLQRSPTYVVSLPAEDAIANVLRKLLPEQLAYRLVRWKNIQFQRYVYRQTRIHPDKVRRKLLAMVRKALGPDYDVDKHFTPSYKPWDQRLCLVPDGDLFKAIRDGRAEVVTDTIATVTPNGIRLASGDELAADFLVTATGLDLVVVGGVSFEVDGRPVDFAETYSYKGMMFSDAEPDLHARLHQCLLVAFGTGRGIRVPAGQSHGGPCTPICTPRLRPTDRDMRTYTLIDDFSPGYLRRVMDRFPKQGDREPWRNTQNYLHDREQIRHAPIADDVLEFSVPASSTQDARRTAA